MPEYNEFKSKKTIGDLKDIIAPLFEGHLEREELDTAIVVALTDDGNPHLLTTHPHKACTARILLSIIGELITDMDDEGHGGTHFHDSPPPELLDALKLAQASGMFPFTILPDVEP